MLNFSTIWGDALVKRGKPGGVVAFPSSPFVLRAASIDFRNDLSANHERLLDRLLFIRLLVDGKEIAAAPYAIFAAPPFFQLAAPFFAKESMQVTLEWAPRTRWWQPWRRIRRWVAVQRLPELRLAVAFHGQWAHNADPPLVVVGV